LVDHGRPAYSIRCHPERSAALLQRVGVYHIKIHGDGADGPLEFDHWAHQLAALAADADRVGAKVGIEFLPWSNIKTVHDGIRLCEAAGHSAAGVIIDVWHTERGGTPASELAYVPLERVVGVELNDADSTVVGTLSEDTAHRRRLCGQGSFDLPGIIGALRTAGWTGPWGVEILSDDFRTLPVTGAAALAYQSAAVVLEQS
jgi:sugar phosphate isomerase/epimerase